MCKCIKIPNVSITGFVMSDTDEYLLLPMFDRKCVFCCNELYTQILPLSGTLSVQSMTVIYILCNFFKKPHPKALQVSTNIVLFNSTINFYISVFAITGLKQSKFKEISKFCYLQYFLMDINKCMFLPGFC